MKKIELPSPVGTCHVSDFQFGCLEQAAKLCKDYGFVRCGQSPADLVGLAFVCLKRQIELEASKKTGDSSLIQNNKDNQEKFWKEMTLERG